MNVSNNYQREFKERRRLFNLVQVRTPLTPFPFLVQWSSFVSHLFGGVVGNLTRIRHLDRQELRGNIRVFCRIRPPSRSEVEARHAVVVQSPQEDYVSMTLPDKPVKSWDFDKVSNMASSCAQLVCPALSLLSSRCIPALFFSFAH